MYSHVLPAVLSFVNSCLDDIKKVHLLLRSVLGLYSHVLPAVVSTVNCCQNVGVSLPFPTKTIRNNTLYLTYQRYFFIVMIEFQLLRKLNPKLGLKRLQTMLRY